MVAVLAHALGIIRRDIFKLLCDPVRCAAAALYHDCSEILTGDPPPPINYHSPKIMAAYKQVEQIANDKLLGTLPPELRAAFSGYMSENDPEIKDIVKAADKLSAYIKCIEELKSGSDEFKQAAAQTMAKIKALNMPEVDYFVEHFIPAFELTLDELNFTNE